ncbi:MAG: M23 family metallopeptidase [Mycobacteriaceae bacterium]
MSTPLRRSLHLLAVTWGLVLLPPLVGPAAVATGAVPAPHSGLESQAAGSPSVAPPTVLAGTYRWPVPGPPHLGRLFDPPATRYGRGHRGIDLVAPTGSTVLAAGAGTVVFAGRLAGRGVVSIQHPDGLRTTYEPVEVSVVLGAAVGAGQPIGVLASGHPGCSAPACLHWGVRRGTDIYLDPLRLVGRWEVRLLAWSD